MQLCEAIADVDSVSLQPRGERLDVLVPSAERARDALAALAPLTPRVHVVPFGDIWLRDTAPIFLHADERVLAATFAFNGWGNKYVLDNDAEVASRIAALTELPRVANDWVLEGGSIDVDGEGTLLTTRQCLLNPNRNASMDEKALGLALASAIGVERVLWLERGLLNDHTDGHVDTLARFVRPGVVLCMEARDTDDPNAEVLDEIARSLERFVDAQGRRLEVVRIPSPGRIASKDGAVLPASYVNFYIANRTVAVPTYASPWDDEAVDAIARAFPGRRTVGIDARAILTGGGAFHCITQQQPAPPKTR